MTGTVCTGEGVTLLRWAAMRSACKLEARGIKVRRGPSVRAQAKRELGLRPRCSDAELLAALEMKIAEVQATLQPGDVQNF